MFIDHFCRNPRPPKGARLNSPMESDLYALLVEGRLLGFDDLARSSELYCERLSPLTEKALRALLSTLVQAGFVLEISGHRLNALTR